MGKREEEDKYILERAKELKMPGESLEGVLKILRTPPEVSHYKVHGWIVREDPDTIDATFGLATGVSVNPDLPETLKKIYIAHEIGHGESIGKKLRAGEKLAFGKEFECLAWQGGIPAAKELGVLDEYLEHWDKDAKYLKCVPPRREEIDG